MHSIPVRKGVRFAVIEIFFFVFPAILALAGEMLLCMKSESVGLRLLPAFGAMAILILVVLYRLTGFLASLIGGFVALLLVGTAFFILAGTAVGWFSFWLIRRTSHR